MKTFLPPKTDQDPQVFVAAEYTTQPVIQIRNLIRNELGFGNLIKNEPKTNSVKSDPPQGSVALPPLLQGSPTSGEVKPTVLKRVRKKTALQKYKAFKNEVAAASTEEERLAVMAAHDLDALENELAQECLTHKIRVETQAKGRFKLNSEGALRNRCNQIQDLQQYKQAISHSKSRSASAPVVSLSQGIFDSPKRLSQNLALPGRGPKQQTAGRSNHLTLTFPGFGDENSSKK